MLLQVGIEDDKAIPNDKNWLYKHPKDALIFRKTSIVWNVLKKVCVSTNNELVTGSLSSEVVFLSKRIQKIEWEIKK